MTTASTMDLAGALGALAGGDREAWGYLYAEMAQELASVAARVTGDAHLAQDAVQETFLDLRRNAGRFRPPDDASRADAAARAWLVGIVTKAALYLARTQRHRRRRDAAPDLPVPPARPDPGEAVVLEDLLRRGLAQLPPKLATAVALRHLAGLDYDELAAAEGCSAGAARVRCHRGLARLRTWCARGGAAASLALIAGALEGATAAAPAVTLPAAPVVGAATIGTITLHGGLSLMTIFGLSGVGLALAATLTATAVWGLPGEDVTGAGTGVAPVGAEPVPADPREPGVGNDPSPAPADPLVSFAFEDTPLRDILAMLSRDTGWSFTVEPDADDLPLVTLSAQDMKLSSAVQWLAAMTKTTITPVPPSDDGAL